MDSLLSKAVMQSKEDSNYGIERQDTRNLITVEELGYALEKLKNREVQDPEEINTELRTYCGTVSKLRLLHILNIWCIQRRITILW